MAGKVVFVLVVILLGASQSRPETTFDLNEENTRIATNEPESYDRKYNENLPIPELDGKPHHLSIGNCDNKDKLLHAETIILNNDGKSRIVGTMRVNVDGMVNITCVKLLDVAGEMSGAYPEHVAGGPGHNYVVLGINAAYGYGFHFYIELYGHSLGNSFSKVPRKFYGF